MHPHTIGTNRQNAGNSEIKGAAIELPSGWGSHVDRNAGLRA
jgi:hypothetical protein